ncbi:MAG: glutamine-hydrolyzing carbamoyl-phosphate synthase small subunit [Proteobacteria bacterium]|nr:glutamine-hydrolyzing carbamoyl-phosphate synthase small subunit [Pseudomonadota bacterium]
MSQYAQLSLEDGSIYKGLCFGRSISTAGEVVFNTGMVGYPESLTDPSYRGQILVLTYPLVGNYGVPAFSRDEFGIPVGFETDRIQAAGLVVSEHSEHYSHFSADKSLHTWLDEEGIPAISGIDTRALTKRLREHGTMLGKIETADEEIPLFDPNVTDLVSLVSVPEVTRIEPSPGSPTVVVLDCGCKASIIRNLLKRGLNVVRVPYDHYFLGIDFDGLLISSGPGDPKMCTTTIRNVEHALAVGKPILGICLGHQILGLATGADTYKLRFGHRSQNQPCLEQGDFSPGFTSTRSRAVITSQNHGYAVRKTGLPEDWRIWFKNANDNTVEGIRHITKPFFGVQFHPEATPGPVDTAWIFDEFATQVRERQR